MSIKNPPISAGIEPATFRFVAFVAKTQRLKHCVIVVLLIVTKFMLIYSSDIILLKRNN
jgi:hypothetical protein